MKRPDSPFLDKIEKTIAEIHACENKLEKLRSQLSEDARAIENIESKATRIDVALYAYWHMPEVAAADLSWGALKQEHPAHLLKLANPIAIDIPCDACGKALPVRSRAEMKKMRDRARRDQHWPEGYRAVCSECEARIFERRRIEYAEREAQEQRHRAWLMSLSYEEYLATSDWTKSLQRHVDFWRWERKTNTLLCGVCGAEAAVGVYHKSLRQLGREGNDDLVFLGTRCLNVVTVNGLIVGVPSRGNLIANCQPTRELDEYLGGA